MNESKTKAKAALEEIFITFSELYKYPTAELFHEIKTLQLEMRLEWLFQEIGYKNVTIKLSQHLQDFKEWEKLYTKCFIGPNQISPPIESLYKVWTTDPSAKMPIANSKGHLYGDPALHMNHLYEKYELRIPRDYQSMPDHLTLLLEFTSFLISQDSVERVRLFLDDHLDWLDAFNHDLTKLGCGSFYNYVTGVLIQLVNTHIFHCLQK